MQFTAMYKKELVAERTLGIAAMALVVAWDIFLATRIGIWREGFPLGLSLLPVIFMPIALIIASIQAFSFEFRDKTSSLWLSIPTSSYVLLGSKTLMILTYAVGTGILSLSGSFLLGIKEIQDYGEIRQFFGHAVVADSGIFAAMFLLLGVVIVSSSLLAAIVARVTPYLHFVAGGVTLFGCLWFLGNATPWVTRVFSFLPDLHLYGINVNASGAHIVNNLIPSELFVALLLFASLFFIAASTLLRRAVDA